MQIARAAFLAGVFFALGLPVPARAQVIRESDQEIRRDAACATDLACDDGNSCTDDICDPTAGCVHEPNALPCDDGNQCSLDDVCSAGWCGGVRVDGALSAGVYSVCAVGSDGRLACWGLDSGGNVSGPNANLDRFLVVAQGYAHACALRQGGRLMCWGADASGSVTGPPASTGRYIDVQVGYGHTCALRADGGIDCWGQESFREVSGPNSSADRFRELAAGGFGTCGVRLDGRLRCWGPNSRAQSAGPNASLERYLSISVNYFHTCALRSDGRIDCWGRDDEGQVSGPSASTGRFTAVSAGGFHTCALEESGQTHCWGSDAFGQVTGAAGTSRAVAVSAGYNHACARRADGRVACWGWDAFGQTSGPNGDARVFGPPGPDCDDQNQCTDDYCDPASGCAHVSRGGACDDQNACSAGDTCDFDVCRGGPALDCDDGNACTDDRCDPLLGCVRTPHTRACDDGDPCTQGETCAAGSCAGPAAPDGNPCSDANACTSPDTCVAGSCASGPAVSCDDSNPCTDDACLPASGCANVSNSAACDDGNACTLSDLCAGGECGRFQPAVALAAGTATTCAVRRDRAVACWGFNYDGQVSGPSIGPGPYLAVSAGHLHTCVLGQDERIGCWGWDADGEVAGPNHATGRYSAVAAGFAHTCGLASSGRLECWGADSDGQVSGPNAASGSFRELAGGYAHTCGLRTDGRIACWGSNSHGQVSGPNAAPGSFRSIRTGWNHTCAVAGDGRLHCWGNDASGQVSGPNASPKQYVALAAGESHTCALGTDARLTCWGADDYGRVSRPNESGLTFGPGVLECDDLNPCTDDACDSSFGCRFSADDTNNCAPADPCVFAACQAGQCLVNPASDLDADGVCDLLDNCRSIFNPDQDDEDADGTGNTLALLRINFAPPSAAVPAGYRQDTGTGFDPAQRYGWSSVVSTRERATPRPLELDTFAFTQAERRFNAEVRNGDYDLRVACGDPSNPQGPHRIRANGVSVVGDLSTARDQFVDTTVRVHVRNGRLDLIVGGTAGNTLLNLLEAGAVPGRPAVLRSINFQPAGSPRPDGWETDAGLTFDGARGYGWSASTQVRERALAFPQVLDTLAFTSGARTWELALPNGQYTVFVGAGDAAFAQGPQRIAVEGSVLIHDESTAAGVFVERQTTVSVTDGRLTLSLGGTLGNTCINYVTIQSAAPPVAPAVERVEPRPRGMR